MLWYCQIRHLLHLLLLILIHILLIHLLCLRILLLILLRIISNLILLLLGNHIISSLSSFWKLSKVFRILVRHWHRLKGKIIILLITFIRRKVWIIRRYITRNVLTRHVNHWLILRKLVLIEIALIILILILRLEMLTIAIKFCYHSRKGCLFVNNTNILELIDIVISWKAYCPCFRKVFEPLRQLVFHVTFIVIVRTMRFFTLFVMVTRLSFKIVRMKLLFFPAMTVLASILLLAAIFVRRNEFLGRPIWAHLFAVSKNLRFSSVVLPIVCIDTNIPLMVIFLVRAPYCFKMKKVEIHIRCKLFYEFNW